MFKDQHDQLRARFNSQFSSLPIAWPNVSFTPPEPKSAWVRFNVIDGEQKQTSIGNTTNNHRNVGLVVIQIFTPDNEGDSLALTTADTIAAIFRNWCGTTVHCRASSVKVIGPDGLGWFQVNVTTPFQRDELL